MQEECSASGVEEELLSFARLVHAAPPSAPSGAVTAAEAVQAAATSGPGPEQPPQGGPAAAATRAACVAGPAGGGSSGAIAKSAAAGGSPRVGAGPGQQRHHLSHLEGLPSWEDAYRVSSVEAVRDLAAVTGLLESAARGGAVVPVRQVAG